MVTGESIGYTGGTTHRPIPLATQQQGIRPAHTHTEKPKTTGLDWDHLERTCSVCRERKPGRLTPEGACDQCAPHVAPKQLPPNMVVLDDANTYVTFDDTQLDDHFGAPSELPQTPQAAEPAPSQPVPAPSHSAAETPRPAATPRVRATVQRSGDYVVVTLKGPLLAHRITEVAALLADLLHGLNQTPAPADAPSTDGLRDQREDGARKGKPTPSPRTKRNYTKAHAWPDEIINDLRTRYTAGASTTDLARDYHCSPTTIGRVLRTNNITLRAPVAAVDPEPITPEHAAQITDAYRNGTGLRELEATHGLGRRRLRELLTTAGVELKPAHGPISTGHSSDRAYTGAVRAWAIDNGLIPATKTTGRLPRAVLDAYALAHPTPSTTHTTQEQHS